MIDLNHLKQAIISAAAKQRNTAHAITTAIITNEPTSELELLKSDIENLKSHISQ